MIDLDDQDRKRLTSDEHLSHLKQRTDAAERHDAPLHVPAFEMRELVAEFVRLRAIVRDLAKKDPVNLNPRMERYECPLCDETTAAHHDPFMLGDHAESCPYRRAAEATKP
jgi:hypothetical protein